jgi:hypothetical protein
MASSLFELDQYLVRRQVFKFLGAGFHVYDKNGGLVAYSKQKAFKLKEDIRVYSDESQRNELLLIQARQIVDFSAAYDMVDSQSGSKVGAARRKGFTSMFRDSWELMDVNDQPIGSLKEDSAGMAMLRRFVNLIPQTFHIEGQGSGVVFKQHFNPFIYKLRVTIPNRCALDRRLIFGAAVLVAAIEGRQR